MSIKQILLAIIIIAAIIFGVTKIIGTLKESKELSTTYMKESMGLKTKAKGLVKQSEKQVKEREKMVEEE